MKKRVFSFVLALTMIATTFLGATPSVQASEDTIVPTVLEAEKDVRPVADITRTTDVADYESAPVNVKRILTSATTKASKVNYQVGANQYVLAPVTSEYEGVLWFDYDAKDDGYASIWFLNSCEIVDGRVQGNGYDLGEYYGGDSDTDDGGVPVEAGKTYWLYIENTSSSPFEINIRGNLYSTATTRTLSEGTSKWTIASGMTRSGGRTSIYFKIKPTKTGYISVGLKAFGDGKSYGKIALYNKNKKKISNTVNYESGYDGTRGKVYFGVTKGNTYYVKVTDVSDRDYYSYKYGVRYSITSATDRSIGTKSSAKTLTRKADSTKTLFRATGSTNTDWYKFKVTSKRKTQVKIDTSCIKSGNVTVTFYKGSKKVGSSDTITTKYDGKTYTITYGKTSGKADAGTYYVKVVKSENASGLYRIRYVQ